MMSRNLTEKNPPHKRNMEFGSLLWEKSQKLAFESEITEQTIFFSILNETRLKILFFIVYRLREKRLSTFDNSKL